MDHLRKSNPKQTSSFYQPKKREKEDRRRHGWGGIQSFVEGTYNQGNGGIDGNEEHEELHINNEN